MLVPTAAPKKRIWTSPWVTVEGDERGLDQMNWVVKVPLKLVAMALPSESWEATFTPSKRTVAETGPGLAARSWGAGATEAESIMKARTARVVASVTKANRRLRRANDTEYALARPG